MFPVVTVLPLETMLAGMRKGWADSKGHPSSFLCGGGVSFLVLSPSRVVCFSVDLPGFAGWLEDQQLPWKRRFCGIHALEMAVGGAHWFGGWRKAGM